jgi:hypothetical protein
MQGGIMNKSWLTFIIGLGIGCAAALVLPLQAQNQRDTQRPLLIGQVNRLINNYCSVFVGRGSISVGRRCPTNEVMTGFDGQYLYCGDITVQCFAEDAGSNE